MTDTQRLREIGTAFADALALGEAERRAWLVELAGRDPELAAAVGRLLERDQVGAGMSHVVFGSSPPASASAPAPWIGRRIGHVRIDEPVARGGMGEVFRGHDEVLERPVAVKTIRPELVWSADSRERFLREARLLSRLDHPNVCRIHDAVVVDGAPVLMLEWVDGTTLDRLDRAALDRVAQLEIAAQIAAALAAAHGEEIVHRDLKPENVMVRPDGVVKVLDFGIARSLATPTGGGRNDSSAARRAAVAFGIENALAAGPTRATGALTGHGSILGTIRYMSPEQALGEPATAASDLYSLGIVLRELIGARPAYPPLDDPLELLERVRWARTEPPATGDGELDALLAELESLDPRRRPAAAALPARLRAHAERPARRRRALRLAAGVTAAALLAGAASYVVARRQAATEEALCSGSGERLAAVWSPARRAALEAAFVRSGASFAVDAFRTAAAAVERRTTDWSTMRRQACEATHRLGEQSPALLDLRMRCLDRRLGELDSLLALLADADADAIENATPAIERLPALEVCADPELLAAPVPPPTDAGGAARVDAVLARLADGRARLELGRHQEALELARAAGAEAREIGYRPLEAEALNLEGSALEWLGEFDAARSRLEAALGAALAGGHDEYFVRSLNDLVWVDGNDQADLAAAERWATLARAQLERLGDPPELAADLANNFGSALIVANRFEPASAELERARALRTRLFGESSWRVAGVVGNLANVAFAQGRYDRAIELNRQALASYERTLGAGHPRLALLLGNLGSSLQRRGDFEEALALQRRALELEEAAYGPESPNVGHDLVNVGSVLLELERPAEALAVHERALALWLAAYGDSHPLLALPERGVGEALIALGRPADALPHLERALGVRADDVGAHADRAVVEFALARALWASGAGRARALELARLARRRLEELPGETRLRATIDSWLATSAS